MVGSWYDESRRNQPVHVVRMSHGCFNTLSWLDIRVFYSSNIRKGVEEGWRKKSAPSTASRKNHHHHRRSTHNLARLEKLRPTFLSFIFVRPAMKGEKRIRDDNWVQNLTSQREEQKYMMQLLPLTDSKTLQLHFFSFFPIRESFLYDCVGKYWTSPRGRKAEQLLARPMHTLLHFATRLWLIFWAGAICTMTINDSFYCISEAILSKDLKQIVLYINKKCCLIKVSHI